MARLIDEIRARGMEWSEGIVDQQYRFVSGKVGTSAMKELAGEIVRAVPVVADNVVPLYYEAKDRGLDAMPSLEPPFPVTWVEGRLKGGHGGRHEQIGITWTADPAIDYVVKGERYATAHLYSIMHDKTPHGPLMSVTVAIDDKGRFLPEASDAYARHSGKMVKRMYDSGWTTKDALVDEQPRLVRAVEREAGKPMDPKGYSVAMIDWDRMELRGDNYVQAAFEGIKMMLMAVGMMNCSNVGTVDVVPAPKLSKKREKRYGAPLTTYKVIQIAPHLTRRHPDRPDSLGTVDEGTALHLCRGHFKTYTEDAPLLGRHVGTFWWKAQIRGSKEAGISAHDYAVSGG